MLKFALSPSVQDVYLTVRKLLRDLGVSHKPSYEQVSQINLQKPVIWLRLSRARRREDQYHMLEKADLGSESLTRLSV